MSGLLPDGFTGYEVPNTLVHGDSGEDVFDLVSKDHSAGKIEVLVSTFGAALDGPKVDYVLIAGGAWSMNSIVQNFGRIRSQCQGASAVVDILYVSDLSSNFWNNLVADAKQNCIALTNPNNGLVVRGEDYMNHCSVVGVKAFVDMKGCRLVNAYRPYGGGEESCGRCDNCRENCAHTTGSNRRYQALVQHEADRIKGRRLFQRLSHVCIVCKSFECEGQKNCTVVGSSCYCCGWTGNYKSHYSKSCAAKESKCVPDGYCRWCLAPRDDTGGKENHGGHPNKCKMKKRLHNFFRYCFRDDVKYPNHGTPNDNGESHLKFIRNIFFNQQTY